jgi:hypothetical protein
MSITPVYLESQKLDYHYYAGLPVKLCIRLIARGIAATVKGRAIGELIKLDLQEIAKMPGFRYSQFNDAVSAYRTAKQERYEGLENEEQLCEALKYKL